MMKSIIRKLFKLRKDDGGAALFYVTITIPVLLAITSLAVDVGYVFYVRTKLQTAADMGALAGASKLYTDNEAAVEDLSQTYVSYNLPTAWTSGKTPKATSQSKVKCITTIEDMGLTCSSLSKGNALYVRVTATTDLFFASALGFKSMTLSADSLVSGGGSSPPPLNVAIVLDATGSMSYSLGNGVTCGILTNPKKIECAMLAAKTLLTKLWSSVDQVALYTYPAFDTNSAKVATCQTKGSLNMTLYRTSAKPNYQMFDFTDSYMDKGSPPSGGLITTSNLVLALGKSKSTDTATDQTNCAGLNANGLGIGTSIADAIQQAQADLIEANNVLVGKGQPKRQNVMIVLSDGDANGNSESLMGPNPPDAFRPGTDIYGVSTQKWVIDVDRMMGQCQAAVSAADAAADAGTWVYSVAFAAPDDNGGSCFTDRKVNTDNTTTPSSSTRNCTKQNKCKAIASATTETSTIGSVSKSKQVATTTKTETVTTCTKPDNSTSGTCTTTKSTKVQTDTYDLGGYLTTACDTMKNIASDESKFYSTDGDDSGKCASEANPNFTDLVDIFNNVAASIMKKRRIPSSEVKNAI